MLSFLKMKRFLRFHLKISRVFVFKFSQTYPRREASRRAGIPRAPEAGRRPAGGARGIPSEEPRPPGRVRNPVQVK